MLRNRETVLMRGGEEALLSARKSPAADLTLRPDPDIRQFDE